MDHRTKALTAWILAPLKEWTAGFDRGDGVLELMNIRQSFIDDVYEEVTHTISQTATLVFITIQEPL